MTESQGEYIAVIADDNVPAGQLEQEVQPKSLV